MIFQMFFVHALSMICRINNIVCTLQLMYKVSLIPGGLIHIGLIACNNIVSSSGKTII